MLEKVETKNAVAFDPILMLQEEDEGGPTTKQQLQQQDSFESGDEQECQY